MSLILLVDASPLLYQVFETVGHLSTTTGEKSGTRFGFLRNIRSWKKEIGADKVVVVYDSPGEVKKAEGFSEYKANREMTDRKVEMYGQLPGVKELVGLTSWSQAEAPGYEADDILGTLARKFEEKGYDVCIATPDMDMLSAVTKKVKVMLTGRKKVKGQTHDFYDVDRVIRETGVFPKMVPLKKAIMGDKSDNIDPMIWGGSQTAKTWGEERLLGVFTKLATLPSYQWFETLCPLLGLPSKEPNFMRELYARLRLMELQEVPELQLTKGEAVRWKLEKEFERLEFKSLLKVITEFL